MQIRFMAVMSAEHEWEWAATVMLAAHYVNFLMGQTSKLSVRLPNHIIAP